MTPHHWHIFHAPHCLPLPLLEFPPPPPRNSEIPRRIWNFAEKSDRPIDQKFETLFFQRQIPGFQAIILKNPHTSNHPVVPGVPSPVISSLPGNLASSSCLIRRNLGAYPHPPLHRTQSVNLTVKLGNVLQTFC